MPHKLGQVFLKDRNILNKIVKMADLTKDDHVVEIGCGDGILTLPISQSVKHIDVIEVDDVCINKTKAVLGEASNVTFHHIDILKTDLQKVITSKTKVVANIPYYISAKIIKKLMTCLDNGFLFALLMVQKEFAEKVMAAPGTGSYTSFSVYTQNFFDFQYGFSVSKNCFFPVPRVDSSVIKLIPKRNPLISDLDHLYFKIVNAAFWGRRKPLKSALKKSPYLHIKGDISEVPFFQENPTIRGEVLSLEMFYRVYEELNKYLLS